MYILNHDKQSTFATFGLGIGAGRKPVKQTGAA